MVVVVGGGGAGAFLGNPPPAPGRAEVGILKSSGPDITRYWAPKAANLAKRGGSPIEQ